jgi:hypothetical protein
VPNLGKDVCNVDGDVPGAGALCNVDKGGLKVDEVAANLDRDIPRLDANPRNPDLGISNPGADLQTPELEAVNFGVDPDRTPSERDGRFLR